ncbi:hypothetical protein ARMGADRAFT_541200 [Armillaria gallica]|uniref:Hydrophobin n=1 Tax=Armillaria gallica TaxID=47427 RepID=A0A2H3DFT4_ARMGA|nr:hypothetical protein ARMGADRAFT_541200 [Armillaria gallica]
MRVSHMSALTCTTIISAGTMPRSSTPQGPRPDASLSRQCGSKTCCDVTLPAIPPLLIIRGVCIPGSLFLYTRRLRAMTRSYVASRQPHLVSTAIRATPASNLQLHSSLNCDNPATYHTHRTLDV